MRPSARTIIEEVSQQSGISVERMLSPSRKMYVVAARHEAMRRLYEANRYSLSEIGKMFNRDHSTVAHAIGKLKRKPSGRGWHRPVIRHLFCQGCRRCRVRTPALPAPKPPPEQAQRYLVPYAGYDERYRLKERV